MPGEFFKVKKHAGPESRSEKSRELIDNNEELQELLDEMKYKFAHQQKMDQRQFGQYEKILRGEEGRNILGRLERAKRNFNTGYSKDLEHYRDVVDVIEIVEEFMSFLNLYIPDLETFIVDYEWLMDSAVQQINELLRKVEVLDKRYGSDVAGYLEKRKEQDKIWDGFDQTAEGEYIIKQIVPEMVTMQRYMTILAPQHKMLSTQGKEYLRYLKTRFKLPFQERNTQDGTSETPQNEDITPQPPSGDEMSQNPDSQETIGDNDEP